ncbi:hypothetical protein KCP71_06675 [Salmonella enterica subsp. enterica]|nr:hypothetical protein KCP71_06675 [Salmonella enterica subsp. enterica]
MAEPLAPPACSWTRTKTSLKNSQFDLLLPLLYDRGDNCVHGSLHRTRTVVPGQPRRRLASLHLHAPCWAATCSGISTCPGHARAGAGLEYWRNFLKLGVNDLPAFVWMEETLGFGGLSGRQQTAGMSGGRHGYRRCRSWAALAHV